MPVATCRTVTVHSLRQQTIPLLEDDRPSRGDQQIRGAQAQRPVAGLRFDTAELGDVKDFRSLLTVLRNLDGVFDAYRMTPGG